MMCIPLCDFSETCEPVLDSANVCTMVIGRMRLFLSDPYSVQVATELVLQNVKAAFQHPDFVNTVGSGLMRIAFVDSSSASSENSIKEDESAGSSNTSIGKDGDSSLGLTLSSVIFVTTGSVALFFLVGSVYLWRRGQASDQDGAATRLASSSSFNGTFDNSRRPTSPYSEMVSGSYRLDRLGEMSILSNGGMSPVYEQDQEDTDTAAGSIVLSEGGYTTDAAGTEGGDSTYFENGSSKFSSSQSEPMYLGARPFPGTVNMDMEEISDSDLDTSGEMSPVKMYVGNKLLLSSGIDHDEEASLRDDESLLFSPQVVKRNDRDGGGGGTVMSDMMSMSPNYESMAMPSP
jgi:hypothetical protein